MEKLIFIDNNSYLRLWKRSDVSEYVGLINNGDAIGNLRPGTPILEDEFVDFIDNRTKEKWKHDFAIVQDEHIVGGTSYYEKGHGVIELGGYWISSQVRGCGLGKKISTFFINYIFDLYPGCKIYLQTLSTNRCLIKIVEGLGFICREDLEESTKNSYGCPIVLLYFEKMKYWNQVAGL